MGSANLRRRLWVPLVGLCLALVAAGASADQTCKYSSIPATAPASRFTDNGDGTVTDKVTALQWKRCSEGQTWSGGTCTGSATVGGWQWALQRADVASYAGRSDWRLPNIKELALSLSGPVIPGHRPRGVPGDAFYRGSHGLLVFLRPRPPRAVPGSWISAAECGGDGTGVTTWQAFRLVRGGHDSGPLNDTGIDWCANGTTNLPGLPGGRLPRQDARTAAMPPRTTTPTATPASPSPNSMPTATPWRRAPAPGPACATTSPA